MSSSLYKEVQKYLVTTNDTFGALIPFNQIDAGTGIDDEKEKEANVRRTSKARVHQKAKDLRAGYNTAFPVLARLKPPGSANMFPWLFDGRHRYFAMKMLMEHDPPPTGNHPYTVDYPIPTVLFEHTMPDSLCRRYGMVTNDIQTCAAGGTAMDILRFLHNEAKELSDRGLDQTVCFGLHLLPPL